jgi:hypothetical protein
MPRHDAGEDSVDPDVRIIDLHPILRVGGSHLQLDPGRWVVGPPEIVRRVLCEAEADPPSRQGELNGLAVDEFERVRLRRERRFQPQPTAGEPDPPSPAEGHGARLTGGDEFLEELGLASGHPVKPDSTRLGMQPTGAERGWETSNCGHGDAAVRLPGIDP